MNLRAFNFPFSRSRRSSHRKFIKLLAAKNVIFWGLTTCFFAFAMHKKKTLQYRKWPICVFIFFFLLRIMSALRSHFCNKALHGRKRHGFPVSWLERKPLNACLLEVRPTSLLRIDVIGEKHYTKSFSVFFIKEFFRRPSAKPFFLGKLFLAKPVGEPNATTHPVARDD